ncbi:MAG TPA: acyltransferase [Acidobacteriaceae bacterium]|nr:acyltransferase [Acidobacteriaceae bacterium]
MTETGQEVPARSWSRLDGVDLLRGLAIFFVLMNHVNMQLLFAHVPYTRGLPKQLVWSLVWNGQQGVQIFFAVSGFLITATSLRRWGSLSHVSVADFYRLRFARIAPLLLGLLTVLSVLHLLHVRHFVVSAQTGGLGRALVAALTFHVNWLEAHRGYLPGNWDILWSLSVEEAFYLAFPWVCRFFGRGKLLIALLLAFIVLGPFGRSVLAHGNPVWREYSYLGGMDAIAMGCLTAIALHGRRLSRGWLWLLGGMGGALLVFCLLFSRTAYAWIPERTGLYMSLVSVGAAMLIAVAAQTGWRSPRAFAPLLRAGQRSYEIYLTHIFVVVALDAAFVAAGAAMRAVPLFFLGVLVIAGLLGEAVARFYSEPMNRWLRWRWHDGAREMGSVLAEPTAASDSMLR